MNAESIPFKEKAYALPKNNRILTSPEFDAVFSKPDIKLSNKYFLILAKKNNLSEPRIGFIVGKKKIPLAVNRNLFRRIIKERFRLKKTELASIDMIVLANAKFQKQQKKDLNEDTKRILSKLMGDICG